MFYLYFDGGSRGNPGISGSGAVLYDNEMREVDSVYFYCGNDKTNNFAEYSGLIKGVELLVRLGIDFKDVVVRGDSLLVIKQCKGEFKVKEPTLVKLHATLGETVSSKPISHAFNKLEHVPRAQNKRADALSNVAMDTLASTPTF